MWNKFHVMDFIVHIVHLAWITIHSSLFKLPYYVWTYISRICSQTYDIYVSVQRMGLGQYLYHQWVKHYSWISTLCSIYGVWCMKKDIFMGVRTCFIISNQAGAPHVSIWKSFTQIHHLLIDESFRNPHSISAVGVDGLNKPNYLFSCDKVTYRLTSTPAYYA